MIEIIYLVLSGMVAISLVITFMNWKFLKSLSDLEPTQLSVVDRPRVSILVPARNEENGITDCVKSLASQTYYPLEILILDDRSTDSTVVNVLNAAGRDDRIRMLEGEDTPPGWVGKSWACDQLYRASAGELLIFMDADTVISPETVSVSVNELTRLEADLLTVMPGRKSKTIVERLMYAFMDWI
ncbi:MAG: glycosyltransferase family 2 protein, partial [Anaerolineales bacterium]|nr:glycosyltransferase family 2 protein [Anaerolineales bacterium]